ncbi:MAG: 50S ribosomal protein L35 [Elusimicrobiota bacterium]
MSRKTHSGAKKRFKTTSKGKISRGHAGGAHLKVKKNSKRRRRLKKSALVHKTDAKRIKKLIRNK